MKILRAAFDNQSPCERLILTHRSYIKRRYIKVFKARAPLSEIGRKVVTLECFIELSICQ
jgi:hypothetical protein